jgi:hypothetical protein
MDKIPVQGAARIALTAGGMALASLVAGAFLLPDVSWMAARGSRALQLVSLLALVATLALVVLRRRSRGRR